MSAVDRGAVRIPIVGVMGSGSVSHAERASTLGRHLAMRGVHLLTGGGGGVMSAVSRAFHEVTPRRGLVVGVLPSAEDGIHTPHGYPNPWVELAIRTHLPLSGARGTDPLSRNHVNVLTSDVVLALPGSAGTASEVALAVRYRKPVAAFVDARGDIPGLPPEVPAYADIEEVLAFVDRELARSRDVESRGS